MFRATEKNFLSSNNIRGSAIIWTVCVMAVSLILITGVISIAQIYHARSLRDTKKQQAFYSAVSVAELVSEDICSSQNYDEWLKMLWNSDFNKPAETEFSIDNLSFENADMGTINLKFEWNTSDADKFPYKMKITVVSEYYEEEESICAEFLFDSKKKWSFVKYCE